MCIEKIDRNSQESISFRLLRELYSYTTQYHIKVSILNYFITMVFWIQEHRSYLCVDKLMFNTTDSTNNLV